MPSFTGASAPRGPQRRARPMLPFRSAVAQSNPTPFIQPVDWPLPKVADDGRRVEANVQPSQMALLLGPSFAANTIVRGAIIAPRALADDGRRSDPNAQQNLNLLALVVAPLRPLDWSLPRIADDGRRTDPNAQGNTNLLAAWFAANTQTRPPIFAPRVLADDGRRVDPLYQSGSALLLTPSARPFNQLDWYLPRVVSQPDRSLVITSPLTLLTAPVVAPLRPFDWPLPRRTDDGRRIDALTQTNASLLAAWFQANTVARVPIFMRRVVADDGRRIDAPYPANLALLAAPAGPRPFIVSDWPLPRGHFVRTFDYTFLGSSLLYIAASYMPIGTRIGLPARLPPRDHSFLGSNLLQTTLSGPPPLPPIRQLDWPLPKTPFQFDRSFVKSSLPMIPPAQAKPFNQLDWPLPKTPFQFDRSIFGSYTLGLIGKDALPFRQSDWPLPKIAAQPDRSFAGSYTLGLIGKDALPFRQKDWPLPRPLPQPDRSYVWNLSPSFLLAVPAPFTQLDWRLPAREPLFDRTFVGSTPLPLLTLLGLRFPGLAKALDAASYGVATSDAAAGSIVVGDAAAGSATVGEIG